jgi:type IV secretory pathway VirB6-like protein
LGSLVVGLITKSIAIFVLAGSLVGIMANIVMGFVSVQLVLALAPVMVPFLMFKPLEWIFDAWLRFLLGACMIKVVLAFLLGATSALLGQMNELAHQTFSDAKAFTPFDALISDVLLLVLSLVFALLATLLIAQAPRIAAGLLAGSSGSVGFSGIKAATGGVPERVMSKSLSAASGRIVQNLKNSASAKAGARDAKSGALSSLKYRNPEAKAAYDEAYRANQTT